jgi:hypothetical protein
MSASNNSTNDTLLAQFYMDDYNRKAQQEKRALEARNNTTASQPTTEAKAKVPEKSDTKAKAVEKVPFNHAAFLAWAKAGPIKQAEDTPVNNNNISNSSSFRLRTF